MTRDDYYERKAQHRVAVFALVANLAGELARIDQGHTWTTEQKGDADAWEPWFHLIRDDGLTLDLSWHEGRGNRPSVRPVVPQLPGRSSERVEIEASFDPNRPPAALAKDVWRRVVQPWAAELPQVQARQAATVQQWHAAERRAAAIAQALGASPREDALTLLQDGHDIPVGLGDVTTGLKVDVTVSNYNDRATFKVEVERDPEFALELARLCRVRFLARLARNGQTLCPGCDTRPVDPQRHSGLCPACDYYQRRARVTVEVDG